uniref:Uncharacterized protein n=1 Tax=Branchiostoma floridae TaxID=7739 RepID=C3XUU0_BRAFL|eukprot:XP_002612156.1 hypothetical protein BRAFLDRAFT_88895 [Branchiostoma floridae]
MRCPASVLQRAENSIRGQNYHNHSLVVNCETNIKIQAAVRVKAVDDVFKSAHSIVQETLLANVDQSAPNSELPRIGNLMRMANRKRETLRPKDHTFMDFEVNYDFIPPRGCVGLQPTYYEKAGAYEFMRMLMVLHFLPAEHIGGMFDEMRQQTDHPLLVQLMEYMDEMDEIRGEVALDNLSTVHHGDETSSIEKLDTGRQHNKEKDIPREETNGVESVDHPPAQGLTKQTDRLAVKRTVDSRDYWTDSKAKLIDESLQAWRAVLPDVLAHNQELQGLQCDGSQGSTLSLRIIVYGEYPTIGWILSAIRVSSGSRRPLHHPRCGRKGSGMLARTSSGTWASSSEDIMKKSTASSEGGGGVVSNARASAAMANQHIQQSEYCANVCRGVYTVLKASDGTVIEQVSDFKYLGSFSNTAYDVSHRIRLAWGASHSLRKLYNGLPRITRVIRHRRLALAGHVMRHDEMAGRVLLWRPDEKRRRGRPSLTLKRVIEEDVGLQDGDLLSVMRDRVVWRSFIASPDKDELN